MLARGVWNPTMRPNTFAQTAPPSRRSRLYGGGGPYIFSGVELQHQLAHLRAQLADLALVDGLLILAARLQPALAGGHERLHPGFHLGLLEVVLAARVDELRLALDQLQQ